MMELAAEQYGHFNIILQDVGPSTTTKYEDMIELWKSAGKLVESCTYQWFLDCLHLWVQLCAHCEIEPNTVAQMNIDKLFSRKERGVIKGSGDNR
jgi:hypothetical protein